MDRHNEFRKITDIIPINTYDIEWTDFYNTALKSVLDKMGQTKQNPKYHGEFDVLTHTKMVCEEIIKQPQYINGSKKDKIILFLAALLHDIGKIKCTIVEDGVIKSPRHSEIGAIMTRELLWKQLGLCGNSEKQQMREAICNLVRFHSFPPYAISSSNPEFRLLKIAANGELVRDFSIEKLCALERADMLGRICNGTDETLEKVEYCRILSEEAECLHKPFNFADDYSKRAYFKGKTNWKEQKLYNDTWGEVILMSGLPGTGKDTWIKENCSNIPMISLDEIRKELKVSATDNQGRVISVGNERAKEYLRKKQPFIWNATNITRQMRAKQVSLFEKYGASVRMVFLETDWDEQCKRNASRNEEVPEAVIEKMLSKLEMPERYESEKVIWEIT